MLKFSNLLKSCVIIMSGGLLAFLVFCCFDLVRDNSVSLPGNRVQQEVRPPAISSEVRFAGEKMPIEYFDVWESLDRELSSNTFFHSNLLLYLKRAARWFPVIEPILQEYGVPDDMKYLALIESNLLNLVSPAGAAGFWQFLSSTGREYGLEVNAEVDERYHPEKATEAACRYLLKAYEKFGTWTGAAASYNMGMAGYERQVNLQKTSSYYDLWLNEETGRYIYRIVAVKLIMSDPERFGFIVEDRDLYSPLPGEWVEVTGSVGNWTDFSQERGMSLKMLKILNPWIRGEQLRNAGNKTYKVRIADPESRIMNLPKTGQPLRD